MATFVGEVLQRTRFANTWISDHISDFALSGSFAALGLLASGENRFYRTLSTILVPIALTLHEYYPIIHPNENAFDKQDIGCYWIGAALVCLVSELSHSKKFQDMISNYSNRIMLTDPKTIN